MIINKDLFDKSRSDMSNPEYIEKLLNMFAGEVKLTTMTDKEMYELRRGHMDILFHITGSIIAHEFAHMVDCHKSRVVKKDFGFKQLGMSLKSKRITLLLSLRRLGFLLLKILSIQIQLKNGIIIRPIFIGKQYA